MIEGVNGGGTTKANIKLSSSNGRGLFFVADWGLEIGDWRLRLRRAKPRLEIGVLALKANL